MRDPVHADARRQIVPGRRDRCCRVAGRRIRGQRSRRPAVSAPAHGRSCRRGRHAAPFCRSWWPDWRGDTAVVIAGGPSAGETDLAPASGARIIAVNESWRLVPSADALYACDAAWWRARAGVQEFGQLKITQDAAACAAYPELKRVHVRRGADVPLLGAQGVIGDGGNSGFQAINLAAQFGASRILLVGFDMSLARGVHWHGLHPRGLNNPSPANIARWRRVLDAAAPAYAAAGVEVINCSAESALTAYPKRSLREALAC